MVELKAYVEAPFTREQKGWGFPLAAPAGPDAPQRVKPSRPSLRPCGPTVAVTPLSQGGGGVVAPGSSKGETGAVWERSPTPGRRT